MLQAATAQKYYSSVVWCFYATGCHCTEILQLCSVVFLCYRLSLCRDTTALQSIVSMLLAVTAQSYYSTVVWCFYATGCYCAEILHHCSVLSLCRYSVMSLCYRPPLCRNTTALQCIVSMSLCYGALHRNTAALYCSVSMSLQCSVSMIQVSTVQKYYSSVVWCIQALGCHCTEILQHCSVVSLCYRLSLCKNTTAPQCIVSVSLCYWLSLNRNTAALQ